MLKLKKKDGEFVLVRKVNTLYFGERGREWIKWEQICGRWQLQLLVEKAINRENRDEMVFELEREYDLGERKELV